MKVPAAAKPEQSNRHGSTERSKRAQAELAIAVADSRPEMEHQQGLLGWMAGSPRLQRKCACGAPSATGGSCGACEEKTSGASSPMLQKQLAIGAADDPLEREAERVADQVMRMERPSHNGMAPAPLRIQRLEAHSDGNTGMVAPPSVERVLAGAGQPLEPGLRLDMQQRFGHDFSGVRVHTDERAAQSTRAVNATAYTVGRNIVFGAGWYRPATESGLHLLAHELAHVVQQNGGSKAPRLQRQRCGHDGKGTACGASNGVWKLIDEAANEAFSYSIDDLVVEGGLKSFGGEWARQVYSPPNIIKSGGDATRGRIDGVKVNLGSTLDVQVVEVKARSDDGGGCAKATREANGYISELKLLAPLIAPMSAKLASVGGLRVESDRCKTPKAAEKRMLESAGVDFSNPSSVHAWCFYNSLQDRLGKTFKAPFSAVNISANADGMPSKTYTVAPPVVINSCRKTKANPTGLGLRYLEYQVNQKGGISYGCRDVCNQQKENENQNQKEKDKELSDDDRVQQQDFMNIDKFDRLELSPDQPQQPRVSVQPSDVKKTVNQSQIDQDQQRSLKDTGEDKPVQLPPGGVSEMDALKETAAVVTTVAILHQSMKYVRTKAEKELARKAIEETIEKGMDKGALQIAKKLDSANIVKYGTREGDLLLKGADEALILTAKNSPRLAARLGPRAIKGLAKAGPIIGLVLAANDARAAISHVSKGGTIELGPSLDDVDLSGDTSIKATGSEGAPKPSGDVSLKDTKIDMELKGAPNVSGNADIETEKVTISGAVASDGSPVAVNMKFKLNNTTITFKSSGFVQNGKVRTGDITIQNSQIEIDLPPGTLDPGRKDGESKTITGKKITVTSLSGGGGATGGTSTPVAAGASGTAGTPQVSTAPPVAGPERSMLIQQIQADKDLLSIYQALAGKEGIVPTDELLRRFIAMKPMIQRHPAAVEIVVKGIQPGQITDPIKQIIEPIEQTLHQENAKLAQKLEQSLNSPGTKGGPPGPAPGAKPTDAKGSETPGSSTGGDIDASGKKVTEKPSDKPEASSSEHDPTMTGGGSASSPVSATQVKFGAISSQLVWPSYEPPKENKPPGAYTYWVRWNPNVGGTVLTYSIPLALKLRRSLPPGSYNWLAEYGYVPPAGTFVTDMGDVPIQFSDAGKGSYVQLIYTNKLP
jgi:hypothetical protein